MKTIVIVRMHLENFKCHRALELRLGGGNANIYGDNASGKTSVYDALTWLLFGKDSRGNGSAEVKPLNAAGEVADHDAVTTVEAVLSVDGRELTLRREYHEVWATRRGDAEPGYEGNVSEYYIDGVPTRQNAFKAAIRELVEEDTFRMLTGVYYFAGELPWQKRREILGQVANLPADRQIMASDSRFEPLMLGMEQRSLPQYRAMLLAQRKDLVGARNELPARIDECQKTLRDLECVDFAAARAELEALQREDGSRALELELGEARLALSQLEAENLAYRRSQEAGHRDTGSIRAELRREERALETPEEALPMVCPTCGQVLPMERREQAIRERENAQARLRERVSILQRELEQAENRVILDLPDYVRRREEAAGKVQKLQQMLVQLKTDTAAREKRIRECIAVLGRESALEYARERIGQLKRDQSAAARKLAETERLLCLLDEFTRYKVSFVEERVNSQFRLARFRLFREQANGGLEERCDVVYNGVPYSGLNSGAKINVGIDILNTLGRVYGVRVPLFVDNAESVTRLEGAAAQVIRLVVTEEQAQLRVEAGL